MDRSPRLPRWRTRISHFLVSRFWSSSFRVCGGREGKEISVCGGKAWGRWNHLYSFERSFPGLLTAHNENLENWRVLEILAKTCRGVARTGVRFYQNSELKKTLTHENRTKSDQFAASNFCELKQVLKIAWPDSGLDLGRKEKSILFSETCAI